MNETASEVEYDVIVVGAGFGGLYGLHRVRELGLSVAVLEAGLEVGGTWYWNRYPGARCDIQSLEYSYSFSDELQQEWQWSERYAAQPEIERYLNHVADRFDLRRDIQFGKRVDSAQYNEPAARWQIHCEDGTTYSARYCMMAVGGYSTPVKPTIDGVDDFAGEIFHTALWPAHEVSFDGKRVGVIGTGSSGMQVTTAVGTKPVEHLYVFQRTPNFCVPARNGPMDPDFEASYKHEYASHRAAARESSFGTEFPVGTKKTLELTEEEFEEQMRIAWEYGGPAVLSAFPDFIVDEAANERVAEYLRRRIRERVDDPKVAELLCPKTHYVGARRLLVEDGFLETFNEPNVTLVDVASAPIVKITPSSVVTADREYELDTLILATGFDSGWGAMVRIDPTGRGGASLRDHWAAGPRTLLGLMTSRFPNMFILYGPGSPGIRSQGALMAELQVDWIVDAIRFAESNGVKALEPGDAAETAWTAHVADVAASTLHVRNDTQYVGANIPGKPRVYAAYLGGVGHYRRVCASTAESRYEMFDQTANDGTTVVASPWEPPDRGSTKAGAL